MNKEAFQDLLSDSQDALLNGGHAAILGLTSTTLRLLDALALSGLISSVEAVYADGDLKETPTLVVPVRAVPHLRKSSADVIVVAADGEKEALLSDALPYIQGTPKVVIGGYEHLSFQDAIFCEVSGQLMVPSLANGYPNCLVHLYQCLQNAARLKLEGVIVEFGMFKGGTTMFLSRVVEKLSVSWKVIGFDTFAGFPPRRSPLDMYTHPDCVFEDLDGVRRYLDGRNVEIVVGDVVETSKRLINEDVLLSFFDTDNYSSARAGLEVVREKTVVGGAIVFDHFTGVDRFRYTLGERFAGRVLLEDKRYFHLHGTGVFYRQQ